MARSPASEHMTIRPEPVIMSERFAKALQDAGIVDDGHICRVVIDAQSGHALMVHVEYFGDEKILNVVRVLDGIEIHTQAGG